MAKITRKRAALLCAGLGTAAALGAFTFGATNALFTSTAGAQDNSITAGTITLSDNGSAVSKAMNVQTLNPGDNPSTNPATRSTYELKYTGTSPAFVGLDMSITSAAANIPAGCAADGTYSGYGAGANTLDTLASDCGASGDIGTLPLFDGVYNGGPNTPGLGLTAIEYQQNATSIVVYDALAPATTCTVAAGTPITCSTEIKNVELRSDFTSTSAKNYEQWNNGDDLTLRLDVSMNKQAGNAFQGSSAHIDLTGHAVQWNNNVASVSGGSPNSAACDSNTYLHSVVADGSGDTYCPASWS